MQVRLCRCGRLGLQSHCKVSGCLLSFLNPESIEIASTILLYTDTSRGVFGNNPTPGQSSPHYRPTVRMQIVFCHPLLSFFLIAGASSLSLDLQWCIIKSVYFTANLCDLSVSSLRGRLEYFLHKGRATTHTVKVIVGKDLP